MFTLLHIHAPDNSNVMYVSQMLGILLIQNQYVQGSASLIDPLFNNVPYITTHTLILMS